MPPGPTARANGRWPRGFRSTPSTRAAEIQGVLAAALGLQVEEAQPLRGVQNLGDTARPDRSGEWALAAGLSLYPVALRRGMEAAA